MRILHPFKSPQIRYYLLERSPIGVHLPCLHSSLLLCWIYQLTYWMQHIQGCIKDHSISQAYKTSIECILHKYCNLFFNIKHLEIDILTGCMYIYQRLIQFKTFSTLFFPSPGLNENIGNWFPSYLHNTNCAVFGYHNSKRILRKWAGEFCNLHRYVQGVCRGGGGGGGGGWQKEIIHNPILRMDYLFKATLRKEINRK